VPEPLLIVVGGIPGSGKSTLARALGDALHLPVVHRDAVKTGIHATHRSLDPAEQRRFSDAAFQVAFAATRTLLAGGSSAVLEAAFHRDHSGPPLLALAEGCDVVWIWTGCPPAVALERYRARDRHPAHNDAAMAEEMASPTFDWARYDPPPGLEPITWVDTSDGCDPSGAELAERLRRRLL
jgi:predicted kinase